MLDATVEDVGLGDPAAESLGARDQLGSHATFDRGAHEHFLELRQVHPRHQRVGVVSIAPDPFISITTFVMPHMQNVLGDLFGGELMALVDQSAAVAAIRHAGGPAVTASIDRVDFREPIHLGELVTWTDIEL